MPLSIRFVRRRDRRLSFRSPTPAQEPRRRTTAPLPPTREPLAWTRTGRALRSEDGAAASPIRPGRFRFTPRCAAVRGATRVRLAEDVDRDATRHGARCSLSEDRRPLRARSRAQVEPWRRCWGLCATTPPERFDDEEPKPHRSSSRRLRRRQPLHGRPPRTVRAAGLTVVGTGRALPSLCPRGGIVNLYAASLAKPDDRPPTSMPKGADRGVMDYVEPEPAPIQPVIASVDAHAQRRARPTAASGVDANRRASSLVLSSAAVSFVDTEAHCGRGLLAFDSVSRHTAAPGVRRLRSWPGPVQFSVLTIPGAGWFAQTPTARCSWGRTEGLQLPVQSKSVYRTTDGRWAFCGDPYHDATPLPTACLAPSAALSDEVPSTTSPLSAQHSPRRIRRNLRDRAGTLPARARLCRTSPVFRPGSAAAAERARTQVSADSRRRR